MELFTLTKRPAKVLAALGSLAGVVGAIILFFTFNSNAPAGDSRGILLWLIVPVALGIVANASVRTLSIGFVWMTVGAICGFVVITGFSFGRFFGWEALACLAAGLLHLEAIRPGWKTLIVPLWFVAGATGMCLPFLIFALTQGATLFGSGMSHPAPAVLWGSEICFGVLLLIAAAGAVAARVKSR